MNNHNDQPAPGVSSRRPNAAIPASGNASAADTTVFVVDDDDALCESLRPLLRSAGLPAETYPSAEAFLESYDPGRPGCLVLDVRMPGMSGPELQEELAARGNAIPIIIVTGHGDVPMAVRAVKMGAVDFLEKPFREQEFLERIRQAVAQDARSRRDQAKRADVLGRLALLTEREREVLDHVVVGRANKQIAAELGVSCKAIEAHRSRTMKKMRVRSTAELVHLVCTSGVLGGPSLQTWGLDSMGM